MSKATDKALAGIALDIVRHREEEERAARAAMRLEIIRAALPMLRLLAPKFVRDCDLDGAGVYMDTVLESSSVMIDTDELLEIVHLAAADWTRA
jgi:hypothetical protein